VDKDEFTSFSLGFVSAALFFWILAALRGQPTPLDFLRAQRELPPAPVVQPEPEPEPGADGGDLDGDCSERGWL
jgi:hypothetical protein